jgi:hypothetical protein
MLYADLMKEVFNHFYIDSNNGNIFLLQIFDIRYKDYVEFDDEYINQLRKRLPRTSVENLLARIVCRQQLHLLSRQSFFSMDEKSIFPNRPNLGSATTMFSPPPYLIIWLDEHFARPENFRSMKRYLFMATLLEEPVYEPSWLECDIDNLIINDYDIDFNLSNFYGHLKMFTNVDQCRRYIDSQQNNLILLITSDRNGRKILPDIYDRILNTYILRNGWNDWQWGFDYIESLQMFDDDQCVLTRIVRDLARYFVDGAFQLPPEEALSYLTWARKLYIQADKIRWHRSSEYTSTILKYIDNQLKHLEAIVLEYALWK